jgi:peroxiredoxin
MKQLVLTVVAVVIFNVGFSQNQIGYGVDMEGNVPKGLNVGDKAPSFILKDVDGKEVSSEKLLEQQELVIIFYRGEWCPVCTKYLSNLNDSLAYITAKGAKVLAIGPETLENTVKTKEKTGAGFTILSDSDQKVAVAYEVLFDVTDKYAKKIKTFLRTDIAENNNSDKAQLPVPATFIIGKDGVIKFKQFDYNYKNRASIKAIIDNLN